MEVLIDYSIKALNDVDKIELHCKSFVFEEKEQGRVSIKCYSSSSANIHLILVSC